VTVWAGLTVTSITFADISKAFGTVWIKELILKLEKYGIKGNLLFWLKSFVSRRKQQEVNKDAISSTGELKTGICPKISFGSIAFVL